LRRDIIGIGFLWFHIPVVMAMSEATERSGFQRLPF